VFSIWDNGNPQDGATAVFSHGVLPFFNVARREIRETRNGILRTHAKILKIRSNFA
jgi:hypothetical protein